MRRHISVDASCLRPVGERMEMLEFYRGNDKQMQEHGSRSFLSRKDRAILYRE